MSRRFEIALTEAQYHFLDAEADRSGVSVAELIRRAIDTTYAPAGGRIVHVITHEVGRRSGRRLDGRDYASPVQ